MSIRTRLLRGLALVAAATLVPLIPVSGVAHAETVPPGPVTGLQIFTHVGSVTLTWVLPPDADYADTVVQMKIGTSAPATITDGVLVNGTTTKVPNLVVPKPGNVTWVDGLDPGTDFTFGLFARDTSGNVAPVTSQTVFGTDLGLTVNRSTVTYGGSTTFTARLSRTHGGNLSGVPVDFYVRQHGTKPWFFWQEKQTVAGVARSTFNAGLNIDVQAYFYGSGVNLGTSVGGMRVNVAQRLTASSNFASRKKGKSFTIHGTIASKGPSGSVTVQRFSKGAWRNVKTLGVTGLHSSGGTTSASYSYTFKPTKKGRYSYRVTKRATSKYVFSVSPTVHIRVR